RAPLGLRPEPSRFPPWVGASGSRSCLPISWLSIYILGPLVKGRKRLFSCRPGPHGPRLAAHRSRCAHAPQPPRRRPVAPAAPSAAKLPFLIAQDTQPPPSATSGARRCQAPLPNCQEHPGAPPVGPVTSAPPSAIRACPRFSVPAPRA